jgi:hypothetical protein
MRRDAISDGCELGIKGNVKVSSCIPLIIRSSGLSKITEYLDLIAGRQPGFEMVLKQEQDALPLS